MKNFKRIQFLSHAGIRHIFILMVLVNFTFSSCSDEEEVVLIPPPGQSENPVTPTPEPENPVDGTKMTAKQVIKAMGTGSNLGNVYDNGYQPTDAATNIRVIDFYYNSGMRHVRIPVTWMDGINNGTALADGNGNVNFQHTRFIQLKATIDYALSKGMYVVMNTHHERWLYNNYDGSSNYDTKFGNLWKNIANYFKDYPQNLVFEVLNEPQGKFGQWGGTPGPNDPQALAFTRQINNVGYTAIRSAGGENTTRIIQVGTNGMGNHNQIDEVYPAKAQLPGGGTDAYLAIHVHTYDPWAFCGQDGSNTAYPGNSTIENSIRNTAAHARTLGVPLNYGEWGVGRDANGTERNTDLVRNYYKLMKNTMLSEGAAPTAWDDRGWFGLISVNGSTVSALNNIIPTMMAP